MSKRAAKPKTPPSVICPECGTATNALVHGRRYLTVENEWRKQDVCAACAARLGPGQYRKT